MKDTGVRRTYFVTYFYNLFCFAVYSRLNTIAFSDNANLVCGGFENSSIRIWSLTPRKLRALKPAGELSRIDKDAGNISNYYMPVVVSGPNTEILQFD